MSDLRRVWTYLLLSLAAGVFVIVITLLGGEVEVDVGGEDRLVLGMALLVLIALGVLSALRPNWRRRAAAVTEGPEGPSTTDGNDGGLPGPPRRGHHPECERFTSHTIQMRGRVRCAGCTGLVVGALPVALLVGTYMASSSALEPVEGSALVMTGLSLVALDLGVAFAGRVNPWAGLGLNALLVAGLALVSIGLMEATGQLTWGLVGVVLSVLWMDTRIQLSRWNHAAVCAVCPEGCSAYTI